MEFKVGTRVRFLTPAIPNLNVLVAGVIVSIVKAGDIDIALVKTKHGVIFHVEVSKLFRV